MNAVEPLADAVTGGLAARTLEPPTGIDKSGHTTERACLNCGTCLTGTYCHACGQKGHVHRSLGAFAQDMLHGVLHFEGKIWRTLPMLLWRPGELTRRYVNGQRASFVSPIALFLFSVFLMFAVVSWTAPPINIDRDALAGDVEQSLEREQQQLDTLEQERAAAAKQGQSTAALDARIEEKRGELQTARRFLEEGIVTGATSRTSVTAAVDSLNKAYLEPRGTRSSCSSSSRATATSSAGR